VVERIVQPQPRDDSGLPAASAAVGTEAGEQLIARRAAAELLQQYTQRRLLYYFEAHAAKEAQRTAAQVAQMNESAARGQVRYTLLQHCTRSSTAALQSTTYNS
jgi:hypothetical protein